MHGRKVGCKEKWSRCNPELELLHHFIFWPCPTPFLSSCYFRSPELPGHLHSLPRKGEGGRGGWPIERWNFGSLDEKLEKWRISPNSAPPAVEADGDPSDGFAPPSDGQNFSWWDGEAKILTLENLMDVPGMVFIWGIRRTRWLKALQFTYILTHGRKTDQWTSGICQFYYCSVFYLWCDVVAKHLGRAWDCYYCWNLKKRPNIGEGLGLRVIGRQSWPASHPAAAWIEKWMNIGLGTKLIIGSERRQSPPNMKLISLF